MSTSRFASDRLSLSIRPMFITLLIVTFLIALLVSAGVARFFAVPVQRILGHIVAEDITYAWSKYLWFAILVVGISSGVRVWELERYITPEYSTPERPAVPLELTSDRWVLEVYRTIVGSLQGIAWTLLVFFVIALLAYVVVRVGESRSRPAVQPSGGGAPGSSDSSGPADA